MEYHILKGNAANYEGASFKELLDEYNKYDKYIYWRLGNKKLYHINKGDKCLIFYFNLPDSSNRILFIGDVVDSDYNNGIVNEKSIFAESEDGDKYIKLNLRGIAKEDVEKYSKDKLLHKYNVKNINCMTSHILINEDEHKQLIHDIEKENTNNQTLSVIANYFERYCRCFFNHKTFREENGFYYIEHHHLVEQNLVKSYSHIENIEKLINEPDNLFNLCPLCHRKIHHAEKEVRKEMINKLYNRNPKYFNKLCEALEGKKSSNSNTLDWLYDIYNINVTKKWVFIDLRNRIIEKYGNKLPNDLIKKVHLRTMEDYKENCYSSYRKKAYIEFSNNLVLDININKAKRIKVINILKEYIK